MPEKLMNASQYELIKYPRTPHLEGSKLQVGDEDLSQIPFLDIAGKKIVVEEKCDGANSAISFGRDGELLLQSRGHFLTGGYRERHYNLFKQWSSVHKNRFFDVLGKRYIMYGEWMYAKHTVFYDMLPHYFLEFDIFDRETGKFLDTSSRQSMLSGLPIVSVTVLKEAVINSLDELIALVGQSKYINNGHIERLRDYCMQNKEDAEKRCGETDPSTLMEGVYMKIEQNGKVIERTKFVRASYLQCVELSNSHWLSRPIIPNQLEYPLENIFEAELL